MAEKKFVIPQKKFRGATSVVSIRIPDTLTDRLDRIAEETGRTRNEIIQLCLEFAVDHLEIE